MPKQPPVSKFRRGRGFTSAGRLVQTRVTAAGESRGFAVARLLTHWSEVVGEDTARLCEPVKVGYGRKGGLGATLTLRVAAAAGPLVQAQSEVIRSRVNACYGYNAIARVRLTQTAAHAGFAEAGAGFRAGAQRAADTPPPDTPPPAVAQATETVTDPGLRAALDRLGTNIHTKETGG